MPRCQRERCCSRSDSTLLLAWFALGCRELLLPDTALPPLTLTPSTRLTMTASIQRHCVLRLTLRIPDSSSPVLPSPLSPLLLLLLLLQLLASVLCVLRPVRQTGRQPLSVSPSPLTSILSPSTQGPKDNSDWLHRGYRQSRPQQPAAFKGYFLSAQCTLCVKMFTSGYVHVRV